MGNAARRKIYDDWSKLIELRTRTNVFKTGLYGFNFNTTGRPRLDVWTSTQPTGSLSYVMVHANFSNNETTFAANFPFIGTWYNLLDNTPLNVTSTTQNITLAADGGYVVYGNQPNTLVSTEPLFGSSPLILEVQNPGADQTAFLRYQAPSYGTVTFNLYSLEGKPLVSKTVQENQGSISLACPFPSGIYLVEMVTANGRKVEKLLLQ
jgi:hypothetical protein